MLQKSSKNLIFSLSLISALGLSSCTSELPEIESESLQETVFSIDHFSSKIKISLSQNMEKKDLQKSEVARTKNNFKKVTLSYISGNEEIKPLVDGITISVPESMPNNVELSFNVNEGHIVAKTLAPSIADINQYSSTNDYYLFQYPISAYGIKRRVKNQNNEETRNIEFHQTEKAEATHLKINNPFLETVELGGLDSVNDRDRKKILNESVLEKNIWSKSEIQKLFNFQDTLEILAIDNIGLNLDGQKIYTFRLAKNKLYIQEIVDFENLTEKEKNNIDLKVRSIALHRCPSYIKKQTNIKNCFARSIYKTRVNPVIIRPKQDRNGQKLATIMLDTNTERSSVIQIFSSSFSDVDGERESLLVDTDDKNIINKNDLDLDSEYIYVPSTHGTPRDVVSAVPFFQGSEKIVRLKMTKQGILVFEEDQDERFRDNEHNESPVFMITGEHIDSSCKEKSVEGICNEIDNTQKNWKDKQYFKPNLDKFKKFQTNALDLFNVGDSCIFEVDSKMTHAEIVKGVINVEQIKTYKVSENSSCMISLYYQDNLKSSSFTVKHFFSLVRLNDLASSNYEAFNYPQENHQAFGFFKDSKKQKGQDYTTSRERTSYLLNRFNPKKETIVYQLSEEFARPENKYILDATHDVVNKLNNSFKKANTKLKINLESPKKIFPGDLRHNSLVLITDPLANGLLGYGPSVTNPRTGEIVQAHTNMYLGVLRTGARRTYKFMEEMAKEKPIQTASTNLSATTENALNLLSHSMHAHGTDSHDQLSQETRSALEEHQHVHALHQPTFNNQVEIKEKDFMPLVANRNDLDHLFGQVHAGDFSNIEEGTSLFEKTMDLYARNNAFHEEAMNYNALGKVIIPEIKEIEGIVKSNGELLAWEKLSPSQKESAIKIIVSNGYKTTLAHEIGHNLGLRHNFKGSYDKDNFYKKSELPNDKKHLSPKYSSIMDYGASELNELPVLGKYDIAAIRYGYANEVEMENGSIQKVSGNDILKHLKRKNYEFCTDENAGGSIECNRFDEGSSVEEIVDHYIRRYKNSYTAANLRDGKESFKSYRLPRYIQYKYFTMMGVRNALDRYNFFRSIFGPQALNGQCPEQYPVCVQINDVYRATMKAGNFFTEIINTPDLTCVVEKNGQQEQRKFTSLYNKVKYSSNEDVITSCFHPDISKALETGESIIAEGGKLLNDLSGTHSLIRSQYDIDVRGIWADKLIAIKMLFGRMSGSDQTAGLSPLSFIEHPDFSSDLFGYISHLTLGEALPKPNKFKDRNGLDVEIPYSLNRDFYLPTRPTWFPTLVFGFPPYSGTDLNELILKNIYKSNKSTDPNLKDHTKMIREMISVYKKSYISQGEVDNALVFISGSDKFVAGKENQIAYAMINVIINANTLNNISSEMAKIVLNNKIKRDAPSSYQENEKAFFDLDNNLIEAIISYLERNPPTQTLAQFVQMTKNVEIATALFIAQEIGLTRVKEIYAQKKNIYQRKVECTEARDMPDTQEETCKVYDLLWEKENRILFLKGEKELIKRAKEYTSAIKKLPTQNSSEYNFVDQLMENF